MNPERWRKVLKGLEGVDIPTELKDSKQRQFRLSAEIPTGFRLGFSINYNIRHP